MSLTQPAPLEGVSQPPTSIPEVLDRLHEIQSSITDPRDGVGCFNYLYSCITTDVRDKVGQGNWFQDNDFVAALDVYFADRYLKALDLCSTSPASAPRSWQVLVERRSDSRIAPLQFAAAGVNAHVNFDLAFALVTTCQNLGVALEAGTQHADYQRINQIFAEKMANLRHHFEDLFERDLDKGVIDGINDHVDDLVVVGTRDVAWHHAEHLWPWRDHPHVLAAKTASLDALVSLAGRGFLIPV